MSVANVAEPSATPNRFEDLPLSPQVQASVAAAGYETPTEIQAAIIPHLAADRDVLAQSQTGSGKTAAFALPLLSKIDLNIRQPQILVLAPTRELAIQVAKSFETYSSAMPRLSVLPIYGGQDYQPQLRALRRGVHVVVGTPGRVIDHIRQGTLDLSSVRHLVLDEADEMLNMGFLEDVQFVLGETPAERQVALFSATMPPAIAKVGEDYLSDPVRIRIKKATTTADSIVQQAVFVPPREKAFALERFLEAEDTDGVLVFTKTKDATISLSERLVRAGFRAAPLNGDMPQAVRKRTIDQLKSKRLDVVVATDVAARGLDVPRISHVFNFDLPHDTESYVHRIGRTGRAGRAGKAVLFCTRGQRRYLRTIENATRQPIEIVDLPSATSINERRIERFEKRLTDAIASDDLTIFAELVDAYATTTGESMSTIAAALASIAQQGRPFLAEDFPTSKPSFDDRNDRSSEREPHSRGERNSHPRNKSSKHRGSEPPRDGMRRYRLAVGFRDGVRPGNIVGAIANEAGLSGPEIGSIQIHPSYSTVDLPESLNHERLDALRTTWVAGRQLRIEPSTDHEHPGSFRRKPGSRRPKHGKPSDRRAGGGKPKAAKFQSKADGKPGKGPSKKRSSKRKGR